MLFNNNLILNIENSKIQNVRNDIIRDKSRKHNDGKSFGLKYINEIRIIGLKFDGIDDYIEIQNNNSLNPDYITISFWIKLIEQFDAYDRILIKLHSTTPSESYEVYGALNTSKIGFAVNDENEIHRAILSKELLLNKWYYMSFVFNGSTIKIYKNGIFDSINSGLTAPLYKADSNLNVGRRGEGIQVFKGYLANIKIFSYILSEVEIKKLYYNELYKFERGIWFV